VSRWFKSKYQNFHFGGILSISPQRLQLSFAVISQKIEEIYTLRIGSVITLTITIKNQEYVRGSPEHFEILPVLIIRAAIAKLKTKIITNIAITAHL